MKKYRLTPINLEEYLQILVSVLLENRALEQEKDGFTTSYIRDNDGDYHRICEVNILSDRVICDDGYWDCYSWLKTDDGATKLYIEQNRDLVVQKGEEMLSKPEHGWTNVTIGEFTDRASYLTDIPVNCMESLINSLRHSYQPFSVMFDAEGWDYTIVSDFHDTYVITDKKQEVELIKLDTGKLDLAVELVNDIEQDFEGWILWDLCELEDREERTQLLTNLLVDLKVEINNMNKRLRRPEMYFTDK